MTLHTLLAVSRDIWRGWRVMTHDEVIVAMGVVYGDICRAKRDRLGREELQKELGNMILSTIRWADDLGFSLDDCISSAIHAQRDFADRKPKV